MALPPTAARVVTLQPQPPTAARVATLRPQPPTAAILGTLLPQPATAAILGTRLRQPPTAVRVVTLLQQPSREAKSPSQKIQIGNAEKTITDISSFVKINEDRRARDMDRGIGACAKKLPLDNLWKTVMAIRGCLNNKSKQPIILTTGFYIKSVGKTETDGPPGTMLLARTLAELYSYLKIIIISDDISEDIMGKLVEKEERNNIIHKKFKCSDEPYPYEDSKKEAEEFISDYNPQLFIAIEKLSLVISKFTEQTTSSDGRTVTTINYDGNPILKSDGTFDKTNATPTGATVSTTSSDGVAVTITRYDGSLIVNSDGAVDTTKSILSSISRAAIDGVTNTTKSSDGMVIKEKGYLSRDQNKLLVNVNTHHSATIACIYKICYKNGNVVTVGIGDGGNELGFGNSACNLPQDKKIPRSTSPADFEIPAITSNYGAIAVCMALCCLEGKMNLIPDLISSSQERELIELCVFYGAVDGLTLNGEATVDGYSDEERKEAYERLVRCFIPPNKEIDHQYTIKYQYIIL